MWDALVWVWDLFWAVFEWGFQFPQWLYNDVNAVLGFIVGVLYIFALPLTIFFGFISMIMGLISGTSAARSVGWSFGKFITGIFKK